MSKKRLLKMLGISLSLALILSTTPTIKAAKKDFIIKKGVLIKYTGKATILKIPRNVKQIKKKAFYKNKYIKKLVIPKNVKVIGKEAFYGCIHLENVTLEKGVSQIKDAAFMNCYNLTHLTMSKGLKKIAKKAFYKDRNIRKIVIPGTVKIIGEKAFSYCTNLKDIKIEEGVRVIKKYAFMNCKNIKKLVLPKSVKIIGKKAFYSCDNLKDIEIKGHPKIGKKAFDKIKKDKKDSIIDLKTDKKTGSEGTSSSGGLGFTGGGASGSDGGGSSTPSKKPTEKTKFANIKFQLLDENDVAFSINDDEKVQKKVSFKLSGSDLTDDVIKEIADSKKWRLKGNNAYEIDEVTVKKSGSNMCEVILKIRPTTIIKRAGIIKVGLDISKGIAYSDAGNSLKVIGGVQLEEGYIPNAPGLKLKADDTNTNGFFSLWLSGKNFKKEFMNQISDKKLWSLYGKNAENYSIADIDSRFNGNRAGFLVIVKVNAKNVTDGDKIGIRLDFASNVYRMDDAIVAHKENNSKIKEICILQKADKKIKVGVQGQNLADLDENLSKKDVWSIVDSDDLSQNNNYTINSIKIDKKNSGYIEVELSLNKDVSNEKINVKLSLSDDIYVGL